MKKLFISLLTFITTAIFSFSSANNQISFPLPGTSIANSKLQYDTIVPAFTVAMIKVGQRCEDLNVIDTQVIQQPTGLQYKKGKPVNGQWTEEWAVNACNKKVYVPIDFILDSKGATFVIDPKNAKLRKRKSK